MNSTPNTKRKPSRLIRCLRWLAMGVAALITLIALFYAVENFRGQRAWESYRKSAEQNGVVFDFAAKIPRPVPAEQNALDVPLVNAWFDPRMRPNGDPTLWPPLFESAQNFMDRDRDRTKRRMTDLVAWKEALAAAGSNEKVPKITPRSRTPQERAAAATNVLAALQDYDPALQQLREAMKRPEMRYPVDYGVEQPFSILLPHLSNIRRVSSLLSVRASAHLALGNSEAAAQDVVLGLHLVRSFQHEHLLISFLVQIACLQTTAQPIWEGMVLQRWTDTQLVAIQQHAEQLNLLRSLQVALEMERAATVTTIDWIKKAKSGQRYQALGEPAGAVGETSLSFASFMPRGWWDMEKVSFARMFEDGIGPISKALKSGSFAESEDPVMQKPPNQGIKAIWKHELLASMLLPALDKVQRKGAIGQALTDEIIVACAIERARLADASYPQSLAGLSPKYLSQPRRDVISGQPLIYRPEANGYLLYSVGWNRTDDGGAPGKVLLDEESGDWTWRIEVQKPAEFE